MLVKIALLLLVAWLIGVSGVYPAGKPVHALLLVGLMLLLLGVAKTLERQRHVQPPPSSEGTDGARGAKR